MQQAGSGCRFFAYAHLFRKKINEMMVRAGSPWLCQENQPSLLDIILR
jgi:hypothetical protein